MRKPASPPTISTWFVPHQANKRIIDASAKKLGIAEEKVVSDRRAARQHFGGVRAAGAVRGCARTAASRRATSVLLEAMGGGFTWGARAGPLVAFRSGRTQGGRPFSALSAIVGVLIPFRCHEIGK